VSGNRHEWTRAIRRGLQGTGKPNSVPLGTPADPACAVPATALRSSDHSSGTAITRGLEQPTRTLRTGRPRTRPYLALLRAGFCLPRPLPAARCALTAPFHPYPPSLLALRPRTPAGGIFSVPLVRRVAPPGSYPAHCPAEFGLSSEPCGPAIACSPAARRHFSRPDLGSAREPPSRPSPAKSGAAPASCRGCCGAYRASPPCGRCSSRARAASRPGRRAPRLP